MPEIIKNIGVKKDGIFYNSYLIIGEKTVLIDTVPYKYSDELIENLKKELCDKTLDYIILTHTESDRAGSFSSVIKQYCNANTYATVAGLKNLEQQTNLSFPQEVSKSNGVLSLGEDITLRFIITHNINWPDSMMVYFEEEQALFSGDAFATENGSIEKYYKKYLSHLNVFVNQALEQLLNLKISTIYSAGAQKCENAKELILRYKELSKPSDYVNDFLIIYQSFSENNKNLSQIAYNVLEEQKSRVEMLDVGEYKKEEILDKIYKSKNILIGTPTIHRNIPNELNEVLISLNHFKMADKCFCAFGSYGWSGEAPNLVYSYLRSRHFETFGAPKRFIFTPTDEQTDEFKKYILDFYNKQNQEKEE